MSYAARLLLALSLAAAAPFADAPFAAAQDADAPAAALEKGAAALKDGAAAAAEAVREGLETAGDALTAETPGEAALNAGPNPAAIPGSEADGAGRAIVAALSQNRVSITANFSGSQIFVFGAVRGPMAGDEKLDVIVTVAGPSGPALVRRKERIAGIWINADEVEVDEAPSFYAVASTGPLPDIMSFGQDLKHRIGINQMVSLLTMPEGIERPETFREAVIRLRREEGLYVELPGAVRTTEDTLFAVDVNLPANLVEGDYRARVFLLQDQMVQDVFETDISVRKVGLERWVHALSRENPALYGLLSIFIALISGWGASEAFRLLRR